MMEIMIDSYKNILIYLDNNLISPSLLGDENIIYLENNAIGAFNKSINKIMDKYKEIPQYTKNKLIEPNEILNLKNESGYNLGYHYGENFIKTRWY